MGVFSSTAESSIWRCSDISCSKIFRTQGKQLWWSLFSQVESVNLKTMLKLTPLQIFLWKTYQNLCIEQPFCKKTWIQCSKFYRPISTLTNTCYILPVQSKWLHSSKNFNYNLALTVILKIIKHHLVKTTFK